MATISHVHEEVCEMGGPIVAYRRPVNRPKHGELAQAGGSWANAVCRRADRGIGSLSIVRHPADGEPSRGSETHEVLVLAPHCHI